MTPDCRTCASSSCRAPFRVPLTAAVAERFVSVPVALWESVWAPDPAKVSGLVRLRVA